MPETPEFQQAQFAFAAHIRNPADNPRPVDVEERRMRIYRELLLNNVSGFLEKGFPVLRSLYPADRWEARLARPFFAQHRCRSPYFADVPREFLSYLEQRFEPDPDDPPFLLELAHYEWVELGLMIAETPADSPAWIGHGDLLRGVPVLSPLCWNLTYRWPVHRLSPGYRPTTPPPQPTHLLVYRDGNDEVRFMEANPVSARLVALLADNGTRSGLALLQQIATELAHPDPDLVIQGGHQTLVRLHHAGIVLGIRDAASEATPSPAIA
ncbi:MAG: DUF2063 domain-containing protein [Thiotrichales bacterium]